MYHALDGRAVMRVVGGVTLRIYVGTYTSGAGPGIHRLRLDPATGSLSVEGEPVAAVSPSFLCLHPAGSFLYAVNEIGETRSDPGGAVSAFSIDRRTGALAFLNQQPSGGAAPCHLRIDGGGRHLLVANYWGGSVSVLPIEADGRLGAATAFVQHEGKSVNPERQEGAHAHAVELDPADRFALVADLGLDEIRVYRFDVVAGTLARHRPGAARAAPGAGPRHLAFHPGGRNVYLINELLSTVTAFAYDAGALAELQTVSTLPAGRQGPNLAAEVAVRPDGRFLYASNRGHDSIAVFAVDAATGRLSLVGHDSTAGEWPRHFAVDPTGTCLLAANQKSDTVVVFRIDPDGGRLRPVGSPLRIPRPVCLTPAADTQGAG